MMLNGARRRVIEVPRERADGARAAPHGEGMLAQPSLELDLVAGASLGEGGGGAGSGRVGDGFSEGMRRTNVGGDSGERRKAIIS
jgi:hypothetical protein